MTISVNLALTKALVEREVTKRSQSFEGPKGLKGDSIKGDKGNTGDKGDSIKGDIGLKGDSIKGDKGDKGDTVEGPQGLKGDTIRGQRGLRGESVKGTKGDKGDKGDKGNTGDNGISIKSTRVNAKDHLIITYSDGRKEDAGELPRGAEAKVPLINNGGGHAIPDAPKSIKYVRSAFDLSGVLSSATLYYIDGIVEMGSQQITVPDGGLSIGGNGFVTSFLKSSADNYTMFVNPTGTYAGNLFLSNLDVEVSGSTSNVMALDNQENNGGVEFNNVNFISCTSLGEVTGYRQGLSRNVGFIGCLDGITLSGTWSGGWAAIDSIAVGRPMTGVLFRAGSSLTLGGSFRTNMNILGLGTTGGIFCDFSPSNILLDAGFALTGLRANPSGSTVPNLPATSTKALIKNCVGIGNTYQGASHTPTADSVVVITTQGELTQLTGAMTLTDAYWYSTANTNGLRLDCSQTVEARCDGVFSFSGQANTVIAIQIRQYVSSTGSYVNIGPEYLTTINGGLLGTLSSNVAFSGNLRMDQGDRAEVWIKNITGTNNITLKAGGKFEVLTR